MEGFVAFVQFVLGPVVVVYVTERLKRSRRKH